MHKNIEIGLSNTKPVKFSANCLSKVKQIYVCFFSLLHLHTLHVFVALNKHITSGLAQDHPPRPRPDRPRPRPRPILGRPRPRPAGSKPRPQKSGLDRSRDQDQVSRPTSLEPTILDFGTWQHTPTNCDPYRAIKNSDQVNGKFLIFTESITLVTLLALRAGWPAFSLVFVSFEVNVNYYAPPSIGRALSSDAV